MVSEGYQAAGYSIVAVDDGWEAPARDPHTHELRADPTRFPSGIKALADYVCTAQNTRGRTQLPLSLISNVLVSLIKANSYFARARILMRMMTMVYGQFQIKLILIWNCP